MSFLDWVADWAENIPLVGDHISSLVRKIQWGIEDAYDWVRRAVDWLYNTWKDFVEDWLENLDNWVEKLKNFFYDYVQPKLDSISGTLSDLKDYVYDYVRDTLWNIKDELWNLKRTLDDKISDAIRPIRELFDDFREWTRDRINYVLNWIDTADDWILRKLNETKEFLLNKANELVKPISSWVNWFKTTFAAFLKDPVGYITKTVSPLINELNKKIAGLNAFINQQLNNLRSGILTINLFLATKLFEFIAKFVAWFLWSFLHDLATLEYDPRTKKVYGQPKNPVTMFLVYYLEIQEPEYEYRSVENEIEAVERKYLLQP